MNLDNENSWREDLAALRPGWAIALLTLLGLTLRLFQLGAQSLWVDELLTVFQGSVEGYSLWTQFLDDAQNPLPMVLVAWMGRIQPGDAWLRLPSALLGAASIPLLYRVARPLAGERAALFATLLLTLHPLHVLHSQEARGYASMLFFGLLCIDLALRAGDKPSLTRMLAIVLAGSATVLSNLSGLFWLAGLGLGGLWSGRTAPRSWMRWFVIFAAILLLTSNWWALSASVHESGRLLPGSESGEALRGESTFGPWALPYAAFALSFGSQLGPNVSQLHQIAAGGRTLEVLQPHLPWIAAAAGVALVLSLGGLPALRRRKQEWWCWALLPLLGAVLLAMRNVKPFNPRYVLAVLPSLLILWGFALDRMPRQSALILIAACLGLDGVALGRQWFEPEWGRADVRGAVRLIEQREGSEDMILAPAVNLVVGHYYRGGSPVRTVFPEQLASDAALERALAELPSEPRYLWYLRARPWISDPGGRLSRKLEERYRAMAQFQLPGVDLLLFDRQVGGGGSD